MYGYRSRRRPSNNWWWTVALLLAMMPIVAVLLVNEGSPRQEPTKASPTPAASSVHCMAGASVLDFVHFQGSVSNITPTTEPTPITGSGYCRATIGFTMHDLGGSVQVGCRGCIVAVVHDVAWPGYDGRAVLLSSDMEWIAPSVTNQGVKITPTLVMLLYPVRLLDSRAPDPNPAAIKGMFSYADVLAATAAIAPGVPVFQDVILAVQAYK